MKPWLRWSLLSLLVLAFILVPFTLWEDSVNAWSARTLATSTHRVLLAGLVVCLLTADVLLPVPSSFVAAGAMALLGPWQGGLTVAAGMTLSAWLGYALGLWGGEPLAAYVAGAAELERARGLMRRYGSWVLLVCRGVPVLAEASTLLAGATRMNLGRFALVTALGNVGLASAYAAVSLLGLEGTPALLAPFACGVVIPALSLATLRQLLPRFGPRSQRSRSNDPV